MYKHQTIEYDKRLPARITLCDSSVDRCRGEPHWHEEMQLIYVDEGSLNMTVGNRKSALNAGDVQLINPGEVHSLKKGSAKYISVHFSRVFVKSFFEAAESCGYVLEKGSQERREMVFLMQKLLAVERNTFDEYSALVKYSLLLKMLRLLLTRCRTERLDSVYGTSRSLDDDVIAVKQYIEANYHRKIMTADFEGLLHYDPTYVMTYFKKQTGMTIMS
ncbi:MAG: AraC family ligand binding domain-containing protein, partial [Ruminococcus sp.]